MRRGVFLSPNASANTHSRCAVVLANRKSAMSRSTIFFSATALLLLAACNESTTASTDELLMSDAFSAVPVGFEGVESSFALATDSNGTGGPGAPWMPGPRGPGGRGDRGPGLGDFMGGGLGAGFLGDIGVGHGPFGGVRVDSTCIFSAGSGDVTCASQTRGGLTTTRVATYKTAAGVAQARPDSTTDYARVRITVAGTRTRRDSATAVVAHASDRTTTGLAQGSDARTVNGTSSGTENTTGTSASGAFTSLRITTDTVKALAIPLQNGRATFPTAGTVIRYMKVTATVAGATPQVLERKETVTYNGTATANAVITVNGVTRNCTVPLPRGRPACE